MVLGLRDGVGAHGHTQKHEKGMASGRSLLSTIRVFMHCDERSFVTWTRRTFCHAYQKIRVCGRHSTERTWTLVLCVLFPCVCFPLSVVGKQCRAKDKDGGLEPWTSFCRATLAETYMDSMRDGPICVRESERIQCGTGLSRPTKTCAAAEVEMVYSVSRDGNKRRC